MENVGAIATIVGLSVFFVYLVEGLRKGVWGLANFFADKWLRRNGWDEKEELIPMVDYKPFWCLFTGVDHLETKKRFTRTKI
jgi:hypothetical protein